MNSLPLWKIPRELNRVGEKLWRAALDRYEPWVQRYHDGRFLSCVSIHAGGAAQTGRLALFLLWQPSGLAPSTFLTLRSLQAAGFCTLAVSNAPLAPDALAALRPHCLAVMQRPNFGHDFGGYRDGLRWALVQMPDLDTLLILNDSTWFPLRETDQTLQTLLANPAPFKGLVRKTPPATSRFVTHLESHFLMIERPILRHPAFRAFWPAYQASRNRKNTILRGEVGLSAAIAGAGFPIFGLIDHNRFMAALSDLAPAALADVLRNAVPVAPRHRQAVTAWLGDFAPTLAWRDRTLDALGAQTRAENFLMTTVYVYACLRHMNAPWLKKRQEHLTALTRAKACQMVATGVIPPFHPDVMAEVNASLAGLCTRDPL